jgi:hypothetical protein
VVLAMLVLVVRAAVRPLFQLDIVGSGSVAQKASGGESLAANARRL